MDMYRRGGHRSTIRYDNYLLLRMLTLRLAMLQIARCLQAGSSSIQAVPLVLTHSMSLTGSQQS